MGEVISYLVQTYSKGSGTYIKSYDKDKSSKYIIYFDKNNFYGSEMTKYLSSC